MNSKPGLKKLSHSGAKKLKVSEVGSLKRKSAKSKVSDKTYSTKGNADGQLVQSEYFLGESSSHANDGITSDYFSVIEKKIFEDSDKYLGDAKGIHNINCLEKFKNKKNISKLTRKADHISTLQAQSGTTPHKSKANKLKALKNCSEVAEVCKKGKQESVRAAKGKEESVRASKGKQESVRAAKGKQKSVRAAKTDHLAKCGKPSFSHDKKETSASRRKNGKESNKREKVEETSESEVSDWEEIDEFHQLTKSQSLKTDQDESDVKIELDSSTLGFVKKNKKRTKLEIFEEHLRKHVNHSIKVNYENMHKTHLLCLLAHGRYTNALLNSETLLAAALSIITEKNAYPPKRLGLSYLEKFVVWFRNKINYSREQSETNKMVLSLPLDIRLLQRFDSKETNSLFECVCMFVIIARSLGINARLVLNLRPISWKPQQSVLVKPKEISAQAQQKREGSKLSKDTPDAASSKSPEFAYKITPTGQKIYVAESKSVKNKIGKRKKMYRTDKSEDVKESANCLSSDSDLECPPTRKCGLKRNGSESDKSKEMSGQSRGESGGERRAARQLSEWSEVYVEEEEKWIAVDVCKGLICCVPEIMARAVPPVAYVTAFQPDLSVKDVTKRYVASWLSAEKKLRCDTDWWKASLAPFRATASRMDRDEEEDMEKSLKQQPLPKTLTEYKNHPLYVLGRHLLKFEALHPPDCSPLGFFKGEPVFDRACVKTLHGKEFWIREAKVICEGEEPYKIVKSRPKWDKNSGVLIGSRDVELFGDWQIEDYEPPVACDGKVPRNKYGNVEMFKPCMLPKGCVHLQLNNLNKTAAKLDIDCAQAMVGFDFPSGRPCPVFDGYVVCEEYKDVLLDAYREEQIELAKKEEEKRKKRVYDNWKVLIKGIMIKKSVSERYRTEEPSGNYRSPCNKPKRKKKKVTHDEKSNATLPVLIKHHIRDISVDFEGSAADALKLSRSKREISDVPVDDCGDKDDEVKQEKIQKILKWTPDASDMQPDLSDESEPEASMHTL